MRNGHRMTEIYVMSYIPIHIVIIELGCFFINCFVHNFMINKAGIFFIFPQDIEMLGSCPAGLVLPHGEKEPWLASFTINIPNGVDVLLHRPASHPIFSC